MTDTAFDTTEDHPIVLIAIENGSFYLYRGGEYLNQLLLADGAYPKPVKCLKFSSVLDVRLILGEAVTVSDFWGIHPQIVERLRDSGELIEIDG